MIKTFEQYKQSKFNHGEPKIGDVYGYIPEGSNSMDSTIWLLYANQSDVELDTIIYNQNVVGMVGMKKFDNCRFKIGWKEFFLQFPQYINKTFDYVEENHELFSDNEDNYKSLKDIINKMKADEDIMIAADGDELGLM